MLTRRKALQPAVLITGAAIPARSAFAQGINPASNQAPAPAGQFQLPPLPYAYDALEPHIDAQTMQIHHDKHHQAYVTNLNAALEKAPGFGDCPLEQLLADLNAVPEAVRTAVRNNGGGHWNHSQFWRWMGPNAGGEP